MAHKFIKKNGKYYRINSDETQTEVLLKDGYFHWTLPDKVRVRVKYDNNLVDMDKVMGILQGNLPGLYKVSMPGGGFTTASSMEEAKLKLLNTLAKYSDASENVANDVLFTIVGRFPKLLYNTTKRLVGTTAGNAIGNAAGSMAIGNGLEMLERAIGGLSAGDAISGQLRQWGVPLADMFRPEYYINPTGKAALMLGNSIARRFTPQGIRIGNYAYKPDVGTMYSGLPLRFKRTYVALPKETSSMTRLKKANYQSLLDNQENIVDIGQIRAANEILNAEKANPGKPIMFTTPQNVRVIRHNGVPYEVNAITLPARTLSSSKKIAASKYGDIVKNILKKYGLDFSIEARLSPRLSMGGLPELDKEIYKSHMQEYGELMDNLVQQKLLRRKGTGWEGEINGKYVQVDPFDYVRSKSKAFLKSGLQYDGKTYFSGMGTEQLGALRGNGGVGFELWSSNNGQVSSYYSRYGADGTKRASGTQVDLVGNQPITEIQSGGKNANADNFREGRSVRDFTTPYVTDLMQYLDGLSKGFGNTRVFGPQTLVKSFKLNNGDFDMSNPDIFAYNDNDNRRNMG